MSTGERSTAPAPRSGTRQTGDEAPTLGGVTRRHRILNLVSDSINAVAAGVLGLFGLAVLTMTPESARACAPFEGSADLSRYRIIGSGLILLGLIGVVFLVLRMLHHGTLARRERQLAALREQQTTEELVAITLERPRRPLSTPIWIGVIGLLFVGLGIFALLRGNLNDYTCTTSVWMWMPLPRWVSAVALIAIGILGSLIVVAGTLAADERRYVRTVQTHVTRLRASRRQRSGAAGGAGGAETGDDAPGHHAAPEHHAADAPRADRGTDPDRRA